VIICFIEIYVTNVASTIHMTAKIANKAFLIPLFLVLGLGLRAQLKADFIASSTNGCTPLLVRCGFFFGGGYRRPTITLGTTDHHQYYR
jgi:hypothetical protein